MAFGPSNGILRRMAQIANEVEARAPQDPMRPLVASSYTAALDTVRHKLLLRLLSDDVFQVRLAETFLGLADSLRKPRGSLVNV